MFLLPSLSLSLSPFLNSNFYTCMLVLLILPHAWSQILGCIFLSFCFILNTLYHLSSQLTAIFLCPVYPQVQLMNFSVLINFSFQNFHFYSIHIAAELLHTHCISFHTHCISFLRPLSIFISYSKDTNNSNTRAISKSAYFLSCGSHV